MSLRDEIRTELEKAVREHAQKDIPSEFDIIDETTMRELHERFACDSLSMVEVYMDLEEHFLVEIPDHKMDHIRTIRQAIDLVEETVLDQFGKS